MITIVAVKEKREQKGLTQRELSKKSKVSQSTISEIENGSKSPTERTLKKLANALDVDIAELIRTEEAEAVSK